MTRLIAFIAVLMCVGPAFGRPLIKGGENNASRSTYEVEFLIDDTADSKEIPVSGFCSVRYQQAGGDDAALYAVPTAATAATSGTLIGTFTSSTTTATTFTAGTRWVKAVATDATVGGSVMVIDCSPLVGSGSGGGGSFDACRSGSVQGGGYSSTDGRWAWTCGNYNWHGWRDATQTTSSYTIECTGEGAPHGSCFRDGETRHINFGIHRIALALQYTRDGGKVYLPEGIYVDGGAGLKVDGVTRAKFPLPYNPEWESRSDFAAVGYPTRLDRVLINRGVRLVAEGTPRFSTNDLVDATVTIHRPKLTGTWLLDDRGTGLTYSGLGVTLDGENENQSPPDLYRIQIGGNGFTPYCHTTSDTDPTCDYSRNAEPQKAPNDGQIWGVDFDTLTNYTPETGTLCVPDSTSSLGSSQDDAIGTCSLNRMIRCWDDDDSDEPRSTGGCNFGAGGSFGACQAPYEALVADYVTAGEDLQIAMEVPQCPDSSASSSDCQSASEIGNNLYIRDFNNSPGEAFTGGSCDSGNGSTVALGQARSTLFGLQSSNLEYPTLYVGSGVNQRIFPVRRGALYGAGAGYENLGRMPVHWYGRDASGSANDCLSNGTPNDNAPGDDETQCDNDSVTGFYRSYGNLVGPNNVYLYMSQLGKSGVVETAPSGGPNDFIGNYVVNVSRGVISDWGWGTWGYNRVENVGLVSTGLNILLCYSGRCNFEGNVFSNVSAQEFYQFRTAADFAWVHDNVYENVNVGGGGSRYNVSGIRELLVEHERWNQTAAGFMAHINPGILHTQKPKITLRDIKAIHRVNGGASNATTGGGNPVATIMVEGDDSVDSRADDYKSLLIEDWDITAIVQDNCFVWFEDDFRGSSGASADSASLAREAAVRATIRNNRISGPATGDGPKIACTGQYEYNASVYDSDQSDEWNFERYAPRLDGNFVNGAPVYDMLPTISEAGLDADDLPDGTRIRIHDGSSTACAHTNGDLTSGSSIASCVSDPGTSGSATDGTWTAF